MERTTTATSTTENDSASGSSSAGKTLWMGGVKTQWTESFLTEVIASLTGEEVVAIKLHNKPPRQEEGLTKQMMFAAYDNAGYGFVEFASHDVAARVLHQLNNKSIPKTASFFRLNWAMHRNKATTTAAALQQPAFFPQIPQARVLLLEESNNNNMSNTTVFVGNLDSNITEQELRDFFLEGSSNSNEDILNVKIPQHKKGCGFVTFLNHEAAKQAIIKKTGKKLGASRIRLDWGKSRREQQGGHPGFGLPGMQQQHHHAQQQVAPMAQFYSNQAPLHLNIHPHAVTSATAPLHLLQQQHQQQTNLFYQEQQYQLFQQQQQQMDYGTAINFGVNFTTAPMQQQAQFQHHQQPSMHLFMPQQGSHHSMLNKKPGE